MCKILYEPAETLQNENVALIKAFKIIFENISSLASNIKDDQKIKELAFALQTFILELVCDPVSEKYKFMANYDSRIFNFDKPNKYKEEIKIMRAILENLHLLTIRDKFDSSALDKYISARQVPQPKAFEQEIVAMIEDPYKRNEYITGVATLKVFHAKLTNTIIAEGSAILLATEYL